MYKKIKEKFKTYFNYIKASTRKTRYSAIEKIFRLPGITSFIKYPKGIHKLAYCGVNAYNNDKGVVKATYKKIYKIHKINRTQPKTLDENIHREFDIESKHESPAAFVAVFPDGEVWNRNGAVVTPDGYLVADVSSNFSDDPKEPLNFIEWKLPAVYKVPGTVAVLSVIGGEGYFHWMFDVLPRIHLLRYSGIFLEDIDKFIINTYKYPYQRETLNLLQIPETKLIESFKYPHLKTDTLVVPSLAGITGNMPNWVCDFLRKEFLHSGIINKSSLSKQIYISRANASCRRVINEVEVINFLKKFGFEQVTLESLSVSEQAALFSSAQVVVAPHGAGLSNVVFCNPGTKVIELFSANYVNVCFWALSNQVGCEYYYLRGEDTNQQEDIARDGNTENILVNIELLSKTIELAELGVEVAKDSVGKSLKNSGVVVNI